MPLLRDDPARVAGLVNVIPVDDPAHVAARIAAALPVR